MIWKAPNHIIYSIHMTSTSYAGSQQPTEWIASLHKRVQPGLWFGIEENGQFKLVQSESSLDHRRYIRRGRVGTTFRRDELLMIVDGLISETPGYCDEYTSLVEILRGNITRKQTIVDIIRKVLEFLERSFSLPQ